MDKGCYNCKNCGRSGTSFPCTDCADDENGIPTHWEAAVTEEINHPPRYKHGDYECIDVMVDVFGKDAVEHFCLLSAFKYVWRKDYKGGIQDIKKAMWYLDKCLELEGEESGKNN
jgi:hypothetical protein